MRLLSILFLLFSVKYHAHGFNITVNKNREYLFGDVLEPLCSVNTSGQNLSSSEVIELFHAWEKYTSAQVNSNSISDFRKAMPCFPGPNLNLTSSNEHVLPPYPSCDVFVNISTATMDEVEDLLKEVEKRRDGGAVDVSLKSVMNSLSNRLQNLIDYLPEGRTRDKTENLLASLTNINTRTFPAPSSQFDVSQLLQCISLSNIPNLSEISGETIGTIICSTFSICSFSDVSSNQCLLKFNITEQQYESILNRTVGELIGSSRKDGTMFNAKGVIGQFFGELTREKRTPKPRCENCTQEDNLKDGGEDASGITPIWDEMAVKMDGREEGSGEESEEESGEEASGESSENHHSFTFDPELLESSGEEEEEEGSGHENSEDVDPDDITKLLSGDDLQSPPSSLPSVSIDNTAILLATKLNASILNYAASFVNDTSLKSKVASAVATLGEEFTVGQLLEKLNVNVSDTPQLLELFDSVKSVLNIPDVDVKSVLEMLIKGSGTGTETSSDLEDKVKETLT